MRWLWRAALLAALALAVWGLLTPSSPASPMRGLDKLQHVGVFLVLGLLAALAFPATPRWRLFAALAVGGAALELAQAYTGRTPDALDAAADAVGSAVVFLFPRRSQ